MARSLLAIATISLAIGAFGAAGAGAADCPARPASNCLATGGASQRVDVAAARTQILAARKRAERP
jgi:hypothetical protein